VSVWGRDNKGAMIRAIGGPGDRGSRVENRAGEPAANPHLYLAAQILSGLDGLERRLDPGPPADTPYGGETERLPRSLMEAVAEFEGSAFWRERLGEQFVDWLVTLKEAEIGRFLSEVTDWEHREYFEVF
jgi:glutamine synthetase